MICGTGKIFSQIYEMKINYLSHFEVFLQIIQLILCFKNDLIFIDVQIYKKLSCIVYLYIFLQCHFYNATEGQGL